MDLQDKLMNWDWEKLKQQQEGRSNVPPRWMNW